MAKKKELTYEEASNELEKIITNLETGNVSVDELTDLVSKASELLAFCKKKLFTTEAEIEKIFNEMNKKEE